MIRDLAAHALVTDTTARDREPVKVQRPTGRTTLTALAGRAPLCCHEGRLT